MRIDDAVSFARVRRRAEKMRYQSIVIFIACTDRGVDDVGGLGRRGAGRRHHGTLGVVLLCECVLVFFFQLLRRKTKQPIRWCGWLGVRQPGDQSETAFLSVSAPDYPTLFF